MESFLSDTAAISGQHLLPGAPELISQLKGAAGCALPSLFREFLERAAGFGSAIYAKTVADRIYYGGMEFHELHELISMQSRLAHHGAVSDLLSVPFFVAGGVTGPGSAMVLVGVEDDPPVLHIEGSNEEPVIASGSLVGETFTGYLDGLLLSERMSGLSRSTNASSFVEFRLSQRLSSDDVGRVFEEFDDILSSLCNHRFPLAGDSNHVGLRNLVDVDHKWVRLALNADRPCLSVNSNSVSTLSDGLILVCLGLSLTLVAGGTVVDHRAALGTESDAHYSPKDAVSLIAHRSPLGSRQPR